MAAAGLAGDITLVQGPAERLARVAGHVVMANVPERVHRTLLACMHAPPVAAVLSGLRPGQGSEVARGYRRLGLRVRGVSRRGGWECWSLAL
jgi:ribosomal protein L11 methylase PrmA